MSIKRILIRGPILTSSGYGVHTRTVYRSLAKRPDLFKLYIVPVNWGQTGWISEDTQERKDLDKIIKVMPELFDLSPRGIREHLNLRLPIYQPTSSYGHFGRKPTQEGHFSWEKTDLVKELQNYFT